jgi:ATP-dependent DNA helicase RecG
MTQQKGNAVNEQEKIIQWSTLAEGQFFERKSAIDRSGGRPKPRKAKAIAWDVAETLAAMANADGGELVVGIEDGGAVTGVPLAEDKVALILGAPRDANYVVPPLRCISREVTSTGGARVIHFAVEWSPEVHRLADGRYLLRVGNQSVPFAADQIAALKQTKSQGLFERSYPPGASLDDVDLELVASLRGRLRGNGSPEDVLRAYRLIEGRNGRAVPCLAALLLFGKDPARWHPRCGIDFVRWEGTERRAGAELNIAKRVRVEHPLALLIEKSREAIQPFIRERQSLEDLFFTERLEYPTFVWQEAIVNAVAHRDYSIQGAGVEVWMFDDRIEIRSPGLPPYPVTVEALARREHLHVSRNPLMVRVLADLGYMRDLGEGIPRMFGEMEREGFYPPRLEVVGGALFHVVLRNQPVYDRSVMEWLNQFKAFRLTGDQKRLLAFAHAHEDRFTNGNYQKLTGLDLYAASNSIKDLIRKGIVRSLRKGSRIYEVLKPVPICGGQPPELARLLPLLQRKREVSNKDIREVLRISRNTAGRLANELCRKGWLESVGNRRWRRYRYIDRSMHHPANAPNAPEAGA